MEHFYIGEQKVFANEFPLIPIYMKKDNEDIAKDDKEKEEHLVAFGLLWKKQVLAVRGYEQYLLMAKITLLREKPQYTWDD